MVIKVFFLSFAWLLVSVSTEVFLSEDFEGYADGTTVLPDWQITESGNQFVSVPEDSNIGTIRRNYESMGSSAYYVLSNFTGVNHHWHYTKPFLTGTSKWQNYTYSARFFNTKVLSPGISLKNDVGFTFYSSFDQRKNNYLRWTIQNGKKRFQFSHHPHSGWDNLNIKAPSMLCYDFIDEVYVDNCDQLSLSLYEVGTQGRWMGIRVRVETNFSPEPHIAIFGKSWIEAFPVRPELQWHCVCNISTADSLLAFDIAQGGTVGMSFSVFDGSAAPLVAVDDILVVSNDHVETPTPTPTPTPKASVPTDVPSNSTSSFQTDVDADENSMQLLLLMLLWAFVGFILLSYIFLRLWLTMVKHIPVKRKFLAELFIVARLLLTLVDFLTDALLCAQLNASHALPRYYFIISLSALVVPAILNMIVLARILNNTACIEFWEFFSRNSTTSSIILFFALTNSSVFLTINSDLLGMRAFQAPLLPVTINAIGTAAVVSNVFEDIPQLVVQVLIITQQDSKAITPTLLFSLAFSCLCIGVGLVKRFMFWLQANVYAKAAKQSGAATADMKKSARGAPTTGREMSVSSNDNAPDLRRSKPALSSSNSASVSEGLGGDNSNNEMTDNDSNLNADQNNMLQDSVARFYGTDRPPADK